MAAVLLACALSAWGGVPRSGEALAAPALRVGVIDAVGTQKVVMVGGVAVASVQHQSLRFYDVSVPASPQLLADVALPYEHLDVAVAGGGNFIAVATATAGVALVDMRLVDYKQQLPEVRGFYVSAAVMSVVVAQGTHLLLAGADPWAREIVDISDATAPRLTARFQLRQQGPVQGMAVSGSWLYIVLPTTLHLVDVSVKAPPFGMVFETSSVPLGYVSDGSVAVRGNHVFVMTGSEGLKVVDVTNRFAPRVAAQWKGLPGRALRGLELAGDYAFVGSTFYWEVSVVNVADALNPLGVAVQQVPEKPAHRITVYGGHAYVTALWGGVQILDMTAFVPAATPPPGTPQPVSGPTPAPVPPLPSTTVGRSVLSDAVRVYATAAAAYVARNRKVLNGFDVSNPSQPKALAGEVRMYDNVGGVAFTAGEQSVWVASGGGLQAHALLPGGAFKQVFVDHTRQYTNVVVRGHHVYAYTQQDGVWVIDTTDINAPAPVTFCKEEAYTGQMVGTGLAAHGDLLFVTLVDGMAVFNISTRAAPKKVGSVNGVKGDSRLAVTTAGTHVLSVHITAGIVVVDVSVPQTPSVVATIPAVLAKYTAVSVDGQYAFIADDFRKLHVLDLADPRAPVAVKTYATEGHPRDVAVRGGYAYLATHQGLEVLDMRAYSATPEPTPEPTPVPLTPAPQTPAPPTDVPPTPAPPVLNRTVGQLPVEGSMRVVLREGVAMVGAKGDSLHFYNVRVPSTPQLLAEVPLPWLHGKAVLTDDTQFALVSHTDGAGLAVVDFRGADYVTQLPEVRAWHVGSTVLPRKRGLAVSGHRAVLVGVGVGSQNAEVVDISVPSAPVHNRYFSAHPQVGGYAADVAMRGDIVYTLGLSSLWINTVGDPSRRLSQLPLPGVDRGRIVLLRGTLLFMTRDADGLRVVDVADPALPRVVGNLPPASGTFAGADSIDNLLFVADGSQAAMHVLDITDATAPRVVGQYATASPSEDVTLYGGHAYVAQGTGSGGVGVEIIDVRDFAQSDATPPPVTAAPGPTPAPAALPTQGTVGSVPTAQPVRHVRALQAQAPGIVVTGTDSLLSRFDTSTPSRPAQVGTDYGMAPQLVGAMAYNADESMVFVCGYSGLEALSLTGAQATPQRAYIDTRDERYSNLAVEGHVLYAYKKGTGVLLLDVTTLPPTELGRYVPGTGSPARSVGLAVRNGLMYVGLDQGLDIVNVANPQQPALLKHVAVSGLRFDSRIYPAEDGRYVYITSPYAGLAVMDVSDPGNPLTALRAVDSAAKYTSLALLGHYALVVDEYRKLHVLDVSYPIVPRVQKVYATDGVPHSVSVRGGHAYVATDKGLQIIDVSEFVPRTDAPDTPAPSTASPTQAPPPAPTRTVGSILLSYTQTLLGPIRILHLGGRHVAMVPLFNEALRFYDVSTDPTAPTQLAEVPFPWPVRDVSVSGDGTYAALAATSGVGILDLRLVDFSQQLPEVRGFYTGLSRAVSVLVDRNHMLVGGGVSEVVDNTRLDAPAKVASLPLSIDDPLTPPDATAMAQEGNYAYLLDRNKLRIVDVGYKPSPYELATLDISRATALSVQGNHVYVSRGGQGLDVIDVSVKTSPQRVATLSEAEGDKVIRWEGLAVAGNRLFVSCYSEDAWRRKEHYNHVCVVDVSSPAAPAVLSRWAVSEMMSHMQVVGGYLYGTITEGFRSPGTPWVALEVIDMRDLLPAPTPQPPTPPPPPPSGTPAPVALPDVATVGRDADSVRLVRVHLRPGEAVTIGVQLRAYDVSDVSVPKATAVVRGTATSLAFTADGVLGWVGSQGGLRVFDFSSGAPALLHEQTAFGVSAVAIQGNFAYVYHKASPQVSDSAKGVIIFDTRNPISAPYQLGSYARPGAMYGASVAVEGSLMFAAVSEGIDIVSTANLLAPTLLRHVSGLGTSCRIFPAGNYVYITSDTGLSVVDVTVPTNPSVTSIDAKMMAKYTGMALQGTYAFVADEYRRLHVMDVSSPTAPQVVKVYATDARPHDVSVRGGYAYLATETGLEVLDVRPYSS